MSTRRSRWRRKRVEVAKRSLPAMAAAAGADAETLAASRRLEALE